MINIKKSFRNYIKQICEINFGVMYFYISSRFFRLAGILSLFFTCYSFKKVCLFIYLFIKESIELNAITNIKLFLLLKQFFSDFYLRFKFSLSLIKISQYLYIHF